MTVSVAPDFWALVESLISTFLGICGAGHQVDQSKKEKKTIASQADNGFLVNPRMQPLAKHPEPANPTDLVHNER